MTAAAAADLLQREIANPDTQWSLGTFGAIAEFSRDRDEAVRLTRSDGGVSALTARGGMAIRHDTRCRLIASESLTTTGWNQRVALCLAEADCAMNRRAVLTELGADGEALRAEDREAILFDLGLDTLQADFCVRIADRDLAARLRPYAGRSLFESDNPAMAMMLAANPHRVFISRLGRIEVYQSIPPDSGKSPEGPHTHILPKLLKSRRTHAATEPIPAGWIPCAHLYPPHPARDGLGASRTFDAARHQSFQRMVENYGDAQSLALKRRIMAAVDAGEKPGATVQTRGERTSIRIALRQMKAAGHASRTLPAWLASFDQASFGEDEDEAALHHDG